MYSTADYFNRRRWRFSKLPDNIFIETVMGCNLRCEMCPVPNSKETMGGRKPCVMSPETFARILDQVSDRPRAIHLNQNGEPLMNRMICEFVALAKKRKHRVSLTTNGVLMDKDMAGRLLTAGVDHVTFSVDGFSPETYESIRIGARYETVRSNLEWFCRQRDQLNSSATVQIDCILSDLTRDEIPLMEAYWRGKANLVNVIPLDDWGGKLELPARFGGRNWMAGSSLDSRYPCDLLWTTLAISAEGFVMYCCHDYKLDSALPNVNDTPLRDIWEQRISGERKKHVEGTVDRTPCLQCEGWKTRRPHLAAPSLLQRVLSAVTGKWHAAT